MAEPWVALTDYLLTLECLAFGWVLARGPRPSGSIRLWFVAFFVASGGAAALGGTVHGFFPAEGTTGHDLLWTLTLLAVGTAAFAAWWLGAALLDDRRWRRGVRVASTLQLSLYATAVLLLEDAFFLAVIDYLPAAVFLLAVFAAAALKDGLPGAGLVAWGVVVILLAAGLQQLRIGAPALHLDHNVVYHLVQALGLAVLFLGARRLPPAPRHPETPC